MKTLVLGGVKSGKSRYAEKRLQVLVEDQQISAKDITVIVTGQPLDDAMAQRIAVHQQQRPAQWRVIEAPLDLPDAILNAQEDSKLILIDCLTLWLTNLLVKGDLAHLQIELDRFVELVDNSSLDVVIVSNETNMGVMPLGQLTRDYCDQIGILHQRLAQVMNEVVLVVAGLPTYLKQCAQTTDELKS